MSALTFLFLCEGSSDEPLVEHLETLVTRQGVAEVLGVPRSGGGSVDDKLSRVTHDGSAYDFVAVHRDADARDSEARIAEVVGALDRAGLPGCPVVPVQMTEAWLLVDQQAIRDAVGRPSGREPLGVPGPSRIERTKDPKSVLKAALLAASGVTGRRRDREARQWTRYRRIILQRLDVDGPVRQLPSWKRLEEDMADIVAAAMDRRDLN